MSKYFQEEIETMPFSEMEALQLRKLKEQVRHVYAHQPYYRKLMDEKGVKPEDIQSLKDIEKLPFLSKQDLRDTYPYGMLAVDLSECVRVQATSGTTGKRVIAFYTQSDLDIWEECAARGLRAMGIAKNDIIQIAYGYGLFSGGAGIHGAAHKVGALTIPMSSGSTDRQIEFMKDLRTTVLACTPSYAAFIGETLAESGGSPSDLSLRVGVFGAEPWTKEMRDSIEKSLGIKAYDIYGLTEISGPGVAFQCECQQELHINEDHFYAEIVDPETGEPLPLGEKGELVFTCLDKKAFPMMRYRTHDITVLSREKCSCGRTLLRMRKPMGRSDDMMIIRGVNVFPSQIEMVLLREGYSANYKIVIDRVNNTDTFDVYVEMQPQDFDDTVKAIAAKEKKLQAARKAMVGISPKVHLSLPKTIERSEGKAKRIEDRRNLHN